MNISKLHRAAAMACIIAMGVVLTGCPALQETQENFSGSAPLDSGGSLTVNNPNGTVTIEGGADTNEVTVTGVKIVYTTRGNADPQALLEAVTINITGDGTQATVETVIDSGTIFANGTPTVEYTMIIPYQADVTVVQANGTVSIIDVMGDITVDQANGAIMTDETQGNLDLNLANGSIRVIHPSTLLPTENIMCIGAVGDIDVYIPPGSAFDIIADVAVGNINSDSFTLPTSGIGFLGDSVSGAVGGGGASLILQLAVGTINVNAVECLVCRKNRT